jgi:hypothetical protein
MRITSFVGHSVEGDKDFNYEEHDIYGTSNNMMPVASKLLYGLISADLSILTSIRHNLITADFESRGQKYAVASFKKEGDGGGHFINLSGLDVDLTEIAIVYGSRISFEGATTKIEDGAANNQDVVDLIRSRCADTERLNFFNIKDLLDR